MNIIIIVGLVFALIGIILLVNMIYKKVNCTMTTTGKVVDISREISRSTEGEHDISLFPIYEFEVNGNTFIKKSSSSSSSAYIGEDVQIKYNPSNPNQYYVKGNYTDLILGIAFTGIGLITIIYMH